MSYSNDFDEGYKIAGFSVLRHFDKMIYGRQTYDILACLGDVGGLEGIILLIGGALIGPISAFMVTVFMAPQLFYYRKNNRSQDVTLFRDLKA